MQRCLRDGADPHAADGNGRTGLWWAARKNQVGCMEALCEAGADIDHADGSGWTPLMIAAAYGGRLLYDRTAAVDSLLARGADWRLTTKKGETALGIAKAQGKAEAAHALSDPERSAERARAEIASQVRFGAHYSSLWGTF